MSRSWVICGEPWAIAATPPMTTKSTPASVRRRSSAARWNSGHSAKGHLRLRLKGEVADVLVGALEALESLARSQAQRLQDLAVVHARRPLPAAQLERAAHRVERALQGPDGHGVARALQARDGRLGDAEATGELGL